MNANQTCKERTIGYPHETDFNSPQIKGLKKDVWRRKWQPTKYSWLENPVDKGAWWAAVHRVMHVCIGEGNGNPLQYSCLENPREGGACWAAVYGVAQSRTWLKRLSSSSNKRDVCSYDGLKSLPPIVLGQWVQTQQMRKNHLSFFGNYKTSPEKWKTIFTGMAFRILSKFQQMPTLGHFSILRNCDENQILQVTFFFFFNHKEGFLLQKNTPMIWLFTPPRIMTRVFTHAWSSPPLFSL